MAAHDTARRQLRERLESAIGHDATDTLMHELHSLGNEQLATRHDMQLGFANVEREMAKLRGELREEIAAQGSALALALSQQTRQLGVWMFSALATLGALAVGAARL